jgi:DNA-binding beta-propeller fold protein YncE
LADQIAPHPERAGRPERKDDMTISSSRALTLTSAAVTAGAGLAVIAMTSASAGAAPAGRASAASLPAAALVAQLTRNRAVDASPDPTGRTIYFTTDGADGPGIFRVPAAGGPYKPVLPGGPLRGPSELAVSNDGRQLFVADRTAGRIFVVPVAGGLPHVLRGTPGSAPQGLELQTRAGRDYVVYTGRDARDGRPAVMRIGVGGASRPTVLWEGAPLSSPDGVAISKTGAIYVSDQAGDHGSGRVLRIDGTRVSTVASGVTLGHPGGIALTLDESKILVSSLNPTSRTAQVLILDTHSGSTTTFDSVIRANHDPGGLHRARSATRMGWADVSRSGRVYRVDP